MARVSVSSTNSNGVGSKNQSTLKNISQFISRKAKEHHDSVNAAYQTFYGVPSAPSSRRTSGASGQQTIRYA
ncbi:hypothetical protein H2200_005824 [Cladophialophora chaetospira]|uniref:Uncharacterized protein n=1 Tax=Cladophialophora chaetospira TaxID=386627 RepID=A0AA38X9S6_9EURO|nr:hypothetical protein H2200_005824 [Cladophialophora chaetospira]